MRNINKMEPDETHIARLETLFKTLDADKLDEIHSDVKKYVDENKHHLDAETKTKLNRIIGGATSNYLKPIGFALATAVLFAVAWWVAKFFYEQYKEYKQNMEDEGVNINITVFSRPHTEFTGVIVNIINFKAGLRAILSTKRGKKNICVINLKTAGIISNPSSLEETLIQFVGKNPINTMVIFEPIECSIADLNIFLENFNRVKNQFPNVVFINLMGFKGDIEDIGFELTGFLEEEGYYVECHGDNCRAFMKFIDTV